MSSASANAHPTLVDVEEDVVIRPLRRVSLSVERGLLLPAGTILGLGLDDKDVSELSDVVVLDLIRRREDWLVRYMLLPNGELRTEPSASASARRRA